MQLSFLWHSLHLHVDRILIEMIPRFLAFARWAVALQRLQGNARPGRDLARDQRTG